MKLLFENIEPSIIERAKSIKLAVFDVDGVMTDGRLLLGESGEEYTIFHAQDGQGLVMLRQAGIYIAIISGRASAVVTKRMAELGIEYVFQGHLDKLAVYNELRLGLQLRAEETLYVGDDLPDIPVMRQCGLAIAVANAHPWVQKHAHWQTQRCGGFGAAREVCDLILQSQGKMDALYQHFCGLDCA